MSGRQPLFHKLCRVFYVKDEDWDTHCQIWPHRFKKKNVFTKIWWSAAIVAEHFYWSDLTTSRIKCSLAGPWSSCFYISPPVLLLSNMFLYYSCPRLSVAPSSAAFIIPPSLKCKGAMQMRRPSHRVYPSSPSVFLSNSLLAPSCPEAQLSSTQTKLTDRKRQKKKKKLTDAGHLVPTVTNIPSVHKRCSVTFYYTTVLRYSHDFYILFWSVLLKLNFSVSDAETRIKEAKIFLIVAAISE